MAGSSYAPRLGDVEVGLGRGPACRFETALRSVAGNLRMLATASRKFLPYGFLLSAMPSSLSLHASRTYVRRPFGRSPNPNS